MAGDDRFLVSGILIGHISLLIEGFVNISSNEL
jgi:hypothetical protein